MIGIATSKVLKVIELGNEIEVSETDFDSYMESLTEDEEAALIALMWVGQGEFDEDDWEDALNTAMTDVTVPAGEYLKSTPDFPDHLEAGVVAMALDEEEDDDEDDDIPEGMDSYDDED